MADGPRVAVIAFGIRGDLMSKPEDEGAIIPVVWELGVRYGRTALAQEEGRLDWFARPFFRCDAGDISKRLAGESDGADAIMRGRAKAKRRGRGLAVAPSSHPP